MQELVGIVRREDEMEQALDEIAAVCRTARRERRRRRATASTIPGWHTALDLRQPAHGLRGDHARRRSSARRAAAAISATTIPSKDAEYGDVQHRGAARARTGAWQLTRERSRRCRLIAAGDRGDHQVSNDGTTATFRDLARRRDRAARSRTTQTEVDEGMVVLDAVHQIQADAGQRPRGALELQGRQVRLVLGRDQRQAAADVHDAARATLPLDEPVTVEPMRAFPLIKDLVTDVSWNFRVKKKIKPFKPRRPTRPTAPGACSRRTSTACRSSASASSASSARTSATCCATTTSTSSSSARASSSTRRRSRCIRSTPRIASPDLKDDARHRLLQHHQVLHEGLSRGHHDHRQRDHSAQGARGRRVLRSARQAGEDLLDGNGDPSNEDAREGIMYTLKVIARDGVPAALQKAERYRLLREAEAAESICLDVLAVDPTNQAATVTLLLACTDQIEGDLTGGVARPVKCWRGSPTSTSGTTTRGSSASAGRTRSCISRRPDRARGGRRMAA